MNGIVRSDDVGRVQELFTALSGARPLPIEIHEIGLDHPQKPEVILHRFRVDSSSIYAEGTRFVRCLGDIASQLSENIMLTPELFLVCRWTASQYSRPPWGDKVLESLNATIRLKKEVSSNMSASGSSMVLGAWKDRGYRVRYHIVKDSVACDIRSPAGIRLHVIMYSMYKGIQNQENVEKGGIYGSSNIVEVWTQVEDDHQKSLLALSWLHGLLSHYNVNLGPLMERKKAIQLEKKRKDTIDS